MDVKNFEFTKDAIGFSAPASSKGKLTSNPEKVYVSKSTKVAGQLVYIRTKDGFKKMFEAKMPSKYKYFELSNLKPLSTSASSFSGSDISNSNLLDDDYSGIRGEKPFNYPRIRGAVAMDLSGNAFRFMRPQFNRPNNFNDYFDGSKESDHSNAIGDWFKETFGKSGDEGQEKVVYTEEEANQLYKKSGAKTPFKDWISSDSSKQFLASLANFGSTLLLANAYNNQNQAVNNQSASSTSTVDNDKKDADDKGASETTILGMHPVTFSLVGIGVLVGAYFGIKAVIKHTN